MSCSQSKEEIAPRMTAFAILEPLREFNCNVQCALNSEFLLKSLWHRGEAAPQQDMLSLWEPEPGSQAGPSGREDWQISSPCKVQAACHLHKGWRLRAGCLLLPGPRRLPSEVTWVHPQGGGQIHLCCLLQAVPRCCCVRESPRSAVEAADLGIRLRCPSVSAALLQETHGCCL